MTRAGRTGSIRTAVAVGVALSGAMLVAACGSDSNSKGFDVSEDSAIAAEVPQSIADKGEITVATDASYAPNEFVNTSTQELEGMDVDLGHALGDVMGIDWK